MATAAARAPERRSIGRSILAVFVGFVTVFVLSLGTDQVLHVLGVYPPWGAPMYERELNLLALAYRFIYTVLGGWLVARLAPGAPMKHVMIFAAIGLVFGLLGVAGAMAMSPRLGPLWYPIGVAITGPIGAWAGGVLYTRRRRQPAAGSW